ncbi:unnamed protein product [Brachionus calyciflorus]|uniref:Uncharacterized protein n=1 Tax=Brachionus calyciflorus TaxID=104777 RepID=A0A814DHE3_9BILA|nr:unnamed protein product [Brachionus calyciflorus]
MKSKKIFIVFLIIIILINEVCGQFFGKAKGALQLPRNGKRDFVNPIKEDQDAKFYLRKLENFLLKNDNDLKSIKEDHFLEDNVPLSLKTQQQKLNLKANFMKFLIDEWHKSELNMLDQINSSKNE